MSTDKGGDVSSDQFLNQSCFDFLLIELVPMAYRIAQEISDDAHEDSGGAMAKLDEEELRDAVFFKLDALGYRVGYGLAEKFSRDKPRPQEPLDSIKFLCKDLWSVVFKKQIDNLKTNHRGVFVLTDNNFAPLRRMSVATGRNGGAVAEAKGSAGAGAGAGAQGQNASQNQAESQSGVALALPFLHFPSGIVRGVLASLGISATVTAEVGGVGLPSAVFQIRTTGA